MAEEKESSEPQSTNSSKSCFLPTVCLSDWWLIRAENDSQGRTLAVAGLTSRQGQALRVFCSAPILKIYDVFNLETVDGVCVVLKGFINKSRSEENGFPSEVFEQFLFGFPPQWEAFNENCLGRESKGKAPASYPLGSEKPSVYSEKVQDVKKLDQKDHVEATGEKIQDLNGREDHEVEDNSMRNNQDDGEVASAVIVEKMIKRATRSSGKLNSTNTSTSIAKEQTAEVHLKKLDQKDHVEAAGEKLQDHNGREDYEAEDNLMRNNQDDGEVASAVIVEKKIKRATRSSSKLNSTNICTSIAKEQTAEVQDLKKLDQKDHVEATGGKLQDHNGREDHEVEDNLMRDNQNDGEVASEVAVQKKIKRATRSSGKLTSTDTSTSIANDGREDYEVEDNLMRDNQNGGEVASEVVVQKKIKRATRSSSKLTSTDTSTSIANDGREDCEVEENLMRDNQNDGEAASEVIVQKEIKRATRSSGKLTSTNTSTSIAKDGREDYEVEENLMRDNQNDGEAASEVIVQKKIKRATRSSDKINSTNISTSIGKEQTGDVNRTTHFKSASPSTNNAKRKLTYGSPPLGKEAAPLVSPETLNFNRSRSGRVLLPPMAFWRNQRAVYDADQSVTEVKQGDPNLDNLFRVSRSEPSRKRRQHR